MVRLLIKFAAVLLLCVGSWAFAAAQSSAILEKKSPDLSEITPWMQRNGTARILVELQISRSIDDIDRPDSSSIAALEDEIRAIQNAVLMSHFGGTAREQIDAHFPRGLRRIDILPIMALEVTYAELEKLAADARVKRILFARADPVLLTESVPLIGMPSAYSSNATGTGQAVVVVDTGVQAAHRFIGAGKVVGEACFSVTSGMGIWTSLCPNGKDTDFSKGAGGNCTFPTNRPDVCSHGTHVAGIAVGRKVSGNLNGTAKDASLVSIQVFSGSHDSATCARYGQNAPCVLSLIDSQMAALAWLSKTLTFGTIKVASINLSFGGGRNFFPCGDDLRAPLVRLIRKAEVAIVAGAGNEYQSDNIAAPACIPGVIAVSASTKDDEISPYSNISRFVSLFAPGGLTDTDMQDGRNIYSSVPGNTFAYHAGTSMASPYVSGAIAAIRSVTPNLEIDKIEAALQTTGKLIQDDRVQNGVKKPRIRVAHALGYLGIGPELVVRPPSGIVVEGEYGQPVSPSTFEYMLEATGGAIDYKVELSGASDWLSAKPTGGTIPVGSAARIVFTVDASRKPPGVLLANVTFHNLTNIRGTSGRAATLIINSRGSLSELLSIPGLRRAKPIDIVSTPNPASVQATNFLAIGDVCEPPCGTGLAARWVNNKPALLQRLEGWNFTIASAMTPEGTAVVGYGGVYMESAKPKRTNQAFLWDATTGQMKPLGFAPGDSASQAFSIDGSGKFVVGQSGRPGSLGTAVVWTVGIGVKRLPQLEGYEDSSTATDISTNGSVIIGTASKPLVNGMRETVAVRWPVLGTIERLDNLAGSPFCGAHAINADGSIIVGSCSGGTAHRAVLWSDNGVIEIEGGTIRNSVAKDISADGSVVIGISSSGPFIWTSKNGMRTIKSVLQDGGSDVSLWDLGSNVSLSPDRTFAVGWGIFNGKPAGWVVRFPKD